MSWGTARNVYRELEAVRDLHFRVPAAAALNDYTDHHKNLESAADFMDGARNLSSDLVEVHNHIID